MPNIPCPHCNRQISDQSKRCLYCAKPLDGGASGDVEKRAQMLSAMYKAGVGLPVRPKESRLAKVRDEPMPVKVIVALLLLPLVLIWPPWWWNGVKTIFRP